MHTRKVLGIAASLRNARWGAGNRGLIDHLCALGSKEELLAYLTKESQLHLENFREAGQSDGKDAFEIFCNLQKKPGDSGLSNSEVVLAAALWAAHKEGADIDHLSLSEHFTASGEQRRPEILREKLLAADGLLISGPVYFGDRGSLAESLIEFIANDAGLRTAMRGRLYGGIAVGAKRNGGQETTLIYQMLDMVNLGFLTVGNDSDTTAQYGGTGHAGDVGTMHKDSYGIDTSMGVGRRMGRVLKQLCTQSTLRDVPRTLFLILQDAYNIGASTVDRLITRFGSDMHASVLNVTGRNIMRCIACDICPKQFEPDDIYSCIIAAKIDSMADLHRSLLYHDLIVPVGVSLQEPFPGSIYQTFLERTRYLRHADFIWSDVLIAPLVLEEPGDYRSLPIRMMTSFLRHHTVMAKPMIGYVTGGEVNNLKHIEEDFSRTLTFAARLAAGRLAQTKKTSPVLRYNPVGYAIVSGKDKADERRRQAGEARQNRLITEAENRLVPPISEQRLFYNRTGNVEIS
jgi:multimeric flavodoxin WrbA